MTATAADAERCSAAEQACQAGLADKAQSLTVCQVQLADEQSQHSISIAELQHARASEEACTAAAAESKASAAAAQQQLQLQLVDGQHQQSITADELQHAHSSVVACKAAAVESKASAAAAQQQLQLQLEALHANCSAYAEEHRALAENNSQLAQRLTSCQQAAAASAATVSASVWLGAVLRSHSEVPAAMLRPDGCLALNYSTQLSHPAFRPPPTAHLTAHACAACSPPPPVLPTRCAGCPLACPPCRACSASHGACCTCYSAWQRDVQVQAGSGIAV